MKEELLKGLNEEQIAKVKGCKSQEELLALAKQEGIELTDEQLEAVNGGCSTLKFTCPRCGSQNVSFTLQLSCHACVCNDCDFHWKDTDY